MPISYRYPPGGTATEIQVRALTGVHYGVSGTSYVVGTDTLTIKGLTLTTAAVGVSVPLTVTVAGTQLTLVNAGTNQTTFATGATGNLTVTPSGTIISVPAGKQIDIGENGTSQTSHIRCFSTTNTDAYSLRMYNYSTGAAARMGMQWNNGAANTYFLFYGQSYSGTYPAGTFRFTHIAGATAPLIFNSEGTIIFDGASEHARFTAGNFGIGTGATVSARLHAVSVTSPQFILGYDNGTNQTTFATGATGNLTVTPSGTQVTFGKAVELAGGSSAGITPSASYGFYAYRLSGAAGQAAVRGYMVASTSTYTGCSALTFTSLVNHSSGVLDTVYGIDGTARSTASGTGSVLIINAMSSTAQQSSANATGIMRGMRSYIAQDASTGTVTLGEAYSSYGNIGASSTMTELRHFSVTEVAGAGTLGTQIGLYVPTLAKGTTNWQIYSVSGNWRLGNDNSLLYLGTGNDATITYDGTNLVINPKVVGSGYLSVAGDLVVDGKTTTAGRKATIRTVVDTADATLADEVIICSKGTAFTLTMNTATVGDTKHIKNIGAGVVTIEGFGTETIDGVANQTLNQWEAITLRCYATGAWGIT
jgi:hypothetical protein